MPHFRTGRQTLHASDAAGPAPAAPPKPRVDYIDGLRALAVLSVLAYHTTIADGARFPNWAFAGSRGVALFFVISGFCLAFPYLHRRRTGRALGLDKQGYATFLVRRASRIAPPFYVVLTAFAVLSFTPFGFPNAAHQDTSARSAAHDYVASVLFFTSKSPLFNASFWTLGIEARWYLLCPLLISLYVRSRLAFALVGAFLYYFYFWSGNSIADEGTLPCFMAGIVAADLALGGNPWQRFAPVAAVVAFGIALLEQSRAAQSDLADPYWHVACFLLVVAAGSGPLRRVFEWRPLVTAGIASYSIYLVHGPVIESLVQSGVPRPLAAIGGLACGFSVYAVIEKPLASGNARRLIESSLRAPFRVMTKRIVLRAET